MDVAVVFKFSPGILAIPVAVAAGALIVAIVLFARKRILHGLIAVFVTFLAGFLFAPAMYYDRVVVTDAEITQTTGFWLSPTVKGFRFADVDHVRITDKPTGPKQRIAEVWEVHYESGKVEDIDPGDLWSSNTERIVPLLEERGVVVQQL